MEAQMRVKASLLSFIAGITLLQSTVYAQVQPDIQHSSAKAVQYVSEKFMAKGATALDDWMIIGLALHEMDVENGSLGTKKIWNEELKKRLHALDARKTTDYARFILTLVAAGKDSSSFAGENLIEKLKKAQLLNGKFADSINGQGENLINAHVWSIIALHAAGEQIPRAKQAKSWLVGKQLTDGGFHFDAAAKQSGVDMTAMSLLAMRALGMNKDEAPVKKALAYLQKAQNSSGGYQEGGASNAESAATVISALIAWGDQPASWKQGKTSVVDSLLSFQKTDGSFAHTKGGFANQIATSQALLALSDLRRQQSYISVLREKAGTRKVLALQDFHSHYWAYQEMADLVKNGYLQGVTAHQMKPDQQVTRAQFAAMLLRAVGEEPNQKTQGLFHDVPASDWSSKVVEKAASLGLMQGSKKQFRPHQGITHEEMATISSRVAKRYGWKKVYAASFTPVNYKLVSPWAKVSVIDMQNRKLIGGTRATSFEPKATVTRAEAAVLIYRLLRIR